jgi:hypothetical protein
MQGTDKAYLFSPSLSEGIRMTGQNAIKTRSEFPLI